MYNLLMGARALQLCKQSLKLVRLHLRARRVETAALHQCLKPNRGKVGVRVKG